MNIRQSLHDRIYAEYPQQAKDILLYFPTYEIMPSTIKMVMINEVVAITPQEDFYTPESGYFTTVARQLALAGLSASSGEVLLNHGIYLTSALKLPKTQITATPAEIILWSPIVEWELELFANIKVIFVGGDIARKCLNIIAKKQTRKHAIPSTPTYKLMNSALVWKGISILPGYILTGKNLLIEKSKIEMNVEQLRKGIAIYRNSNSNHTNNSVHE
ncbi:hypothetical protein HFM57_002834 [Escherichia coli]|uniref:hypothetical protein n=1 Tax=Escherichia coli TaxID=562 RepID=UPI0002C5E4E6|nr:hypothetical protein [Escherichia coli]EEW7306234.1 hypothetical protein [Escherichia coli]EEY5886275.1 hypothetical protein [Escherichia coli]EFB1808336.1 hypothetical protein [Escherichia coli]EFC6586952.1 hypothetical protein [Escherichia coli]EFE2102355.1 hypothetical protein [Escherichia coli]